MHQQTPTPAQTKQHATKNKKRHLLPHYLNFIYSSSSPFLPQRGNSLPHKTWGSRRRWDGEPDANEARSYVRYVHQLVQAGLLGNDKNIEMFPFATLKVGAVEKCLGKPTRMAINDQSLKGNWPVLALIQNSTKWWQYFSTITNALA